MKCIFNQTTCSSFCFLSLFIDPACLKINKDNHCYVSDPSCQPIELYDEMNSNYEVIIYPCISVLVAVCIIIVICLLRHKNEQCSRRIRRIQGPERTGTVHNTFLFLYVHFVNFRILHVHVHEATFPFLEMN